MYSIYLPSIYLHQIGKSCIWKKIIFKLAYLEAKFVWLPNKRKQIVIIHKTMYFVIYNSSQLNLYYLPILERYMNAQCWGSSTSVPENINIIIIFYIITKGTPIRQNGVVGLSKGENCNVICGAVEKWCGLPSLASFFLLYVLCTPFLFYFYWGWLASVWHWS